MVFSRRKETNGASNSRWIKLSSPESDSDTIHVRVPMTKQSDIASTALLDPVVGAAHSRSISEHDLSLTSPFTSEKPRDSIMSTPIQAERDMTQHVNVRPSSALRQWAPASASPAGNALDPITVTDSSPLCKPRHDLTRTQRQQPVPHLFVGRGYEKLYSSQPSRPALAPLPANGSTFTGHLNQDMYRMMSAKMAAVPELNMSGSNFENLPFEVQYPISAQYLQRGAPSNVPGTYAQYLNHQPPSSGYTMAFNQKKLHPTPGYAALPTEDEERSRSKAIQYIREYQRRNPHKRRLSEIDPDETSFSESGHVITIPKTSPIKPVPRPAFTTATSPLVNTRAAPNTELSIYCDEDSNLDLKQVTSFSELLTSLLKLYPHSKDQKSMRSDISMLVTMLNQHFTAWKRSEKKSEKSAAPKRRKVTSKSQSQSQMNLSSGQIGAAAERTTKQEREKTKQDNEMRQVLSAEAYMWQDGSGQGVADVFATEAGSLMGENVDEVVDGFDEKSEG